MRRQLIPVAYLILVVGLSAKPATADDLDLISAAKKGDLAEVQALLAAGADPDWHDRHHNTALIFAARDGRYEIARTLIVAGAEVNWIDGEGVTPLILAAHKNHPAIARLLLDHGAETHHRDKWGRRARDYAPRRGENDKIAEMLRATSP